MPSSRLYVGVTKKRTSEVFRAQQEPTEQSHGKHYVYIIGPFRTRAGAEVMAKYGHNNPHLQTVYDAEKMAARIKSGGYDSYPAYGRPTLPKKIKRLSPKSRRRKKEGGH